MATKRTMPIPKPTAETSPEVPTAPQYRAPSVIERTEALIRQLQTIKKVLDDSETQPSRREDLAKKVHAAWLIFFDVEGVQKMRTVIVDSVALGAGWHSMPSPLDPEKRWADYGDEGLVHAANAARLYLGSVYPEIAEKLETGLGESLLKEAIRR
jgi:hypothetical protein